jgi:hypothetical protein
VLEPFDCYTPGARRLYTFEARGDQHLLTAEARRTLDAIAAAAPALIEKNRLTRDEAAQQAALWLAIAENLEALAATQVDLRCRELRARNGIAWSAKVRELRREIEARRGGYPAEISKGRLTTDQAQQQLERLEAVHDLYWRHGYAFDGSRDELRAMTGPVLDSYDFTEPSEEAA